MFTTLGALENASDFQIGSGSSSTQLLQQNFLQSLNTQNSAQPFSLSSASPSASIEKSAETSMKNFYPAPLAEENGLSAKLFNSLNTANSVVNDSQMRSQQLLNDMRLHKNATQEMIAERSLSFIQNGFRRDIVLAETVHLFNLEKKLIDGLRPFQQ
ncbi:MAG: hypothetical protein V4691_04075 [Pseudomonadota bacterium]